MKKGILYTEGNSSGCLVHRSVGVWAAASGRVWLTASSGGKSKPPNVVLVITDDQGYGDLGCHGNLILRTPNLDALYQRSVRLTDFHVGPTCAPTRASLMTGRCGNRTGVRHTIMGRSLLRRDEVTMADVFAAGGYHTGTFGKWRLGDNYPFRSQDRGFHEVLVHGGGGVGQTPDFWGNDYFDDAYWHNGKPEKHTGYCTDVRFDAAMRFIEANRDRPFFAYLATNAPHGPYNVSERYRGVYEGKDVPNANFYGMIANIDENMGRLPGRLKSLGFEENTILIFMTDNGTAAGFQRGKGFNAAMRGTKGSEYDGGHRVPCFVRWPAGGLDGGRDVNRLTAHIDQPINAALPGGKAIRATRARLVIGEIDLEKAVPEDAKEVVFRVGLQPGKAKLQTWFTAGDGASRGACCVYVKRVS